MTIGDERLIKKMQMKCSAQRYRRHTQRAHAAQCAAVKARSAALLRPVALAAQAAALAVDGNGRVARPLNSHAVSATFAIAYDAKSLPLCSKYSCAQSTRKGTIIRQMHGDGNARDNAQRQAQQTPHARRRRRRRRRRHQRTLRLVRIVASEDVPNNHQQLPAIVTVGGGEMRRPNTAGQWQNAMS